MLPYIFDHGLLRESAAKSIKISCRDVGHELGHHFADDTLRLMKKTSKINRALKTSSSGLTLPKDPVSFLVNFDSGNNGGSRGCR